MNFHYNFNSYLITNTNQKNKKDFFNSTDSFSRYETNLLLKNKNWYYYEKEVLYEYNSFGYRTKEFDDLNNDYFICFGCSNTEGIGLEYDKIWSNLLSKEINFDLFNLGMGGSSIDYQYMNTVLLQKKIKKSSKKPKFVVYLWPSQERASFGYYEEGNNNIDIITPNYVKLENTIKNDFFEWYKVGYILNEGEKHRQNFFSIASSNSIWENMNVPVINMTFDERLKNFENESLGITLITPIKDDFARDMSHYGNKTQEEIKNKIFHKLDL